MNILKTTYYVHILILDRLTSVSFNDGEATVSYTYDDNSNLVSQTVNGVVTEYMYNQAGLMTSQSTEGEKSYSMEYNLRGLKTKETDSNGGEKTYTYDVLGQLISEDIETPDFLGFYNYRYDTRGNRTGKTAIDEYIISTDYEYDKNNKLTREIETYGQTDTIFDYTYDNNGNMVSRLTSVIAPQTEENPTLSIEPISTTQADTIEGAEAVFYTYNKLNQLVSVEADNGMTASYEYDAMGRRDTKTVNGEQRQFYYDGFNIITEVIPDTTGLGFDVIKQYHRGKNLIASSIAGVVSRYGYDPHGNVVAIRGTEVYSYDAFGNQIADNPAYVNPFRYCGEYFDQETGLIYLRARYYDSSIGRFISEDPIKDGVNWYAYCGNDPINFWDPLGYLRGPGYNNKGEWSENPDADDYGENSKVYIALQNLTNAWNEFEEYRTAIEELANEMRWIGNEWGSSKIDEEIGKILEIEQASSLNTVEQVLAAAYQSEAIMIEISRRFSDMFTKMLYNEDGNGTNEANAFKHLYWSAYATSEIGVTYTKLFLNAHEFGWYEQNLNNPEAMKMDLHNNQRGRYLGSLDSRNDLLTVVLNDMSKGNAAILVNGKSVLNGR